MATPVGGTPAPDTMPPTVAITSPTSASTSATAVSPMTLGGTAGDNVAVTQVSWRNDRGGDGTAAGTTNWSVSAVALQTGPNVITMTARDAAGNTGNRTLTVTYTPDTTPPTVAMTAPTAGAVVSGNSVSVTVTASDNDAVAGIQFLLDGATLGVENTTAPYSITWNKLTTSSGSHSISARARDRSANTATSAPVAVVVDNQPPSGTVLVNAGAASTTSQTVALTLAASDLLSGVTQMRFSNDGVTYSTPQAYATSATWTLSGGAGTKTVSAQFRDGAGNWSPPTADAIILQSGSSDTTPPTVTVTAPGPGTAVSGTVTARRPFGRRRRPWRTVHA